MSDVRGMMKESGTLMVLGILFVIVSVALGAAVLYMEDMVATPMGKIGAFIIVIANFILIGYVIVSLAGMKKQVSKVVGGITSAIILLPRRIVLIVFEMRPTLYLSH